MSWEQELGRAVRPTRVTDGKDLEEALRPRRGSVYRWEKLTSTRAGMTYVPGTLLYVLEETRDFPHGEIGPQWKNWVCLSDGHTSVWATLEGCVEREMLSFQGTLDEDELLVLGIMSS